MDINPYCVYLENMPFIDNKGNLKLCCKNKTLGTAPELTIENTSLKDLYSHAIIQEKREELKQGIVPSGCNICVDHEKTINSNSFRQRQFNSIRDIVKAKNFNFDKTKIQALDLRLGSTCNLICTMCHPSESSRWYSVSKEFFHEVNGQTLETAEKIKQSNHPKLLNWAENDQSWENIISSIDQSLVKVYLAGGEPFYIKKLPQYLKKITEVSPYAYIEINTNGTCFLSDKSIKELNGKLNLRISIDGYGSYEEYQRSGTSWQKKVEVMDQYYKNFRVVSFDITLSSLTLRSLPKLIDFLRERYPGVKVLLRPVTNRSGLELNVVPYYLRENVINYLEDLSKTKEVYNFVNVNQIKHILNEDDLNKKEQLQKYVNFWDKLNKFSYANVDQELYDWIMT